MMKQGELLAQGLQELHYGSSLEDVVERLPLQDRRELELLLNVAVRLQELPRNIEVSQTTKARLRAQLLAEIRQPVPQPSSSSWKEALSGIFSFQTLRPFLVRPLGAALSAFLAFSIVGGGTVSAAMDSIPGDGLYPVKTALEQARLTLNVDEQDKAQTYLWMANSRVDELNRLVAVGRLSETSKVISDYEHNVSQALRLAAAQKEQEADLRLQVNSVQTSLKDAYEKAPQAVQTMLAQTLSLAAARSAIEASDQTTDRTTSTANNTTFTSAVATDVPGDTSTTAGLPTDPIVPKDKGDIAGAPTTPAKANPISNPPAPVPTQAPPSKGNLGPEPGPVVTSDTAIPAIDANGEPSKSDPVSGNNGNGSVPGKLNGDALPGKGIGTIQGTTGPLSV